MLVDSALFEGESTLVAENVASLPSAPAANALVYLTVQSGANAPGLYMRQGTAWVWLTDSSPVT